MTVLCLIAAADVNAGAEFGVTGHDLLELCESDVDADKAVCAYYIAGVSGGVAQATILTGDRPPYCLPIGIKLYQLPKLFEQFVTNKPELLEYPSDSLTVYMLKSSFPCATN